MLLLTDSERTQIGAALMVRWLESAICEPTESVRGTTALVPQVHAGSSQPLRYVSLRNFSASGALGHCMVLAFHCSFLPVRIATRPSRPTSVSAAPYSKFEPAAGPPLQASSQSR